MDDAIVAEIGYDTDYAAAVHERFDLNHNYPGTGNPKGQPKYLENTLQRLTPRFATFVAGRVKEELGG